MFYLICNIKNLLVHESSFRFRLFLKNVFFLILTRKEILNNRDLHFVYIECVLNKA